MTRFAWRHPVHRQPMCANSGLKHHSGNLTLAGAAARTLWATTLLTPKSR